jgi:hypothetical protein
MPQSMRRSHRTIRRLTLQLTWERADQERLIRLRNLLPCRGHKVHRRILRNSRLLRHLIQRPINKNIIREARLDWLIDIQHVGFVVEGPWVESSAVGVVVDVAGSTHDRGAEQGGLAHSASEVDDQGSRFGALAGLEVPEEGADVVIKLQNRGGEVDIAAVRFDSCRGFTEECLDDWLLVILELV